MTGFIRLWATWFVLSLLLVDNAHATGFTLTINVAGSGIVDRNPTNNIIPPGANVILTAISNDPSWYFSSWSGDATGSANPLNVTMNSNKVVTATFLQLPSYTLTLATNGQGTISLNPTGGIYLSNSVVTATATAATGWVFVAWSGSTNGNANPLSIAMNANSSLTGTFAQLPAFDTQPFGVTNVAGSTVSFTTHAVGNAPLGYQWFFSGGSINNATNTTLNTLILTNVRSANAGNYWIIATNSYGSATSSVVTLVVTNSIGTTNVVNSPDEASLRAAIKIGGWVSLGFNGTVTITNTINITNNVMLDGSSVSATISGGNAVRLFYVAPGASLSMTNLTLANGNFTLTSGTSPADAGAIYNNSGTVILTSCTLTNNIATDLVNGGVARGGAIFNNGGTVLLCGSSISNNSVVGGIDVGFTTKGGSGFGGAIFTTNGSVLILNCTINSNLSLSVYGYPGFDGASLGGALFQSSGSLSITGSILAANAALGGTAVYHGVNPIHPASAYGGAMAASAGSATIDHCQFFANTATGGDAAYHGAGSPAFGGAIYSAAALTIRDSSVFGNGAFAGNNTIVPTAATKGTDGFGGAIYNLGTTVLDRCSVYSNYVQGGSAFGYGGGGSPANGGNGLGGGVFNASQLAATNCTIALNSVIGGAGDGGAGGSGAGGNALGGGIFNNINATVVAVNLTIASNACISPFLNGSYGNGLAAGSQIANTNGTLRLHNSIIAYGGTNGNSFGVITDDGFNISSDGSANLSGGASYNYTDPKLSSLADYGGPTPCMALLSNSPAIDFGDTAGLPTTDQRGFVRPVGDGPDMGAYEYGSYLAGIPTGPPGYLSISANMDSFQLSFTAPASKTCRLQVSTNLSTWFDLSTNGPFATATNVSQTISQQGLDRQFFRLLMQ